MFIPERDGEFLSDKGTHTMYNSNNKRLHAQRPLSVTHIY